MNLQKLLKDIELQNEWADELARHTSPSNKEPDDSLRHLLHKDDQER